MKRLLLLFSIFLLFGNFAIAQAKPDCANAKTQIEMNLCAKQQFVDADKQLNVIYKKVTAKCDAEMRAALVKAQKAWLTYREEHAAMEALLYEGGSMAPMAALNAKTATTQARIKELQDLLSELDL